jgi:hypothetical protein
MNSDNANGCCQRKWTYSLKSLMFLTSVVAVCSALIGVSMVLAVFCFPFVAAALMRTMRIQGRASVGEQHHGLFVTFCQSLLIFASLISVSAIAFMVACCAGALIVLGVAVHLFKPVAKALWTGLSHLLQFMIRLWENFRSPAFQDNAVAVYKSIRAIAVMATVSLVASSNILFQRWWNPLPT